MAFASAAGVASSADAAQSTAPYFMIAETTGQLRWIILRDRALPYQPLEFSGKMRVETSYYAGNPIATQQPLGSEEGKTTVHGTWKDRFVASGNAVGGAAPAQIEGHPFRSIADLVEAVDDFRRQGQQLEVSWGHIVRVGMIVDFTQKWLRLTDVEWSITFEWASQGEGVPPAAPVRPSLPDAAAQVRGDVQDLTEAGSVFAFGLAVTPTFPPNPFATPSQTIADVFNAVSDILATPADFQEEVVGHIQNLYSAVDAFAELATQAAAIPGGVVSAFQRAAALGSYILNACRDIEAEIDARPSIYFFNVALPPPALPGAGALPIASVSSGQMLRAEVNARKLRKRARDARLRTAELRSQMAAAASPSEMLAVFVARTAQDLRQVATTFYGSQTPWRDLAIFNALPTSKLVAGQLVYVPKTPPASTAQGIPVPSRPGAANTAGGS